MVDVKHTMRSVLTIAVAAWLVSLGPAVTAQESPLPTGSAPMEALRADVRPATPLCDPFRPVLLRFTLLNTSDAPVDIPLSAPISVSEGIVLPIELVLGTDEQPSLSLVYRDETPKVIPPAGVGNPIPLEGSRSVRLAPHGSVGAEIDLRRYFQRIRYTGVYHVRWTPLNGQLGTVTTTFRVEPRQDAILVTDLGKATFVLEYEKAPQNIGNFLELAREGFYNGKSLHRVVPGFVIQGGCPKGDGTGIRPDGKLVRGEFHDARVEPGTLAMARKPSDPDSASCQFFVALTRLEDLDGQYTIIGHARDEESLRTLQQLAQVPTDQANRPLTPLTIRSVNLVDAVQNASRDVKGPPGPSDSSEDNAPAKEPGAAS